MRIIATQSRKEGVGIATGTETAVGGRVRVLDVATRGGYVRGEVLAAGFRGGWVEDGVFDGGANDVCIG